MHEMRGLIQLRNEVVSHLREPVVRQQQQEEVGASSQKNSTFHLGLPALPEPLNLRRACGACPHLLACSLHQVISARVPPSPHAMADLAPQSTAHLTQAHLDFYKKWSVATALEKEVGNAANTVPT